MLTGNDFKNISSRYNSFTAQGNIATSAGLTDSEPRIMRRAIAASAQNRLAHHTTRCNIWPGPQLASHISADPVHGLKIQTGLRGVIQEA